MTRFVVTTGLYILFIGFTTVKLTCGNDEVVYDCPMSCRTACPKSESEAKEACIKPDPCPEPACKCGYFSRRSDNGTCIDTKDCPPFDCSARPNEKFDPCPPICPSEDCSQAPLKGKCPFRIGIILICNPACRCMENYYRKNGTCVPVAECDNDSATSVQPKDTPTSISTSTAGNKTQRNENKTQSAAASKVKSGSNSEVYSYASSTATAVANSDTKTNKGAKTCGKNEEYKCKKACPPETCFSIIGRFLCDMKQVCKYDCFCKDGFLRANDTAPCRPICDCKEINNSPECQQKNSCL